VNGDFVDNEVWDKSIKGNNDIIKKIMESMKDEFKEKYVYKIIGNKEKRKINVYEKNEIDDEKVYKKWL
jgi:hypothetical protein